MSVSDIVGVTVLFVIVEPLAESSVLAKPRTAVVIKCPLVNLPIHWYKNGKHITTGAYYHVDEQNSTLTINRAGILVILYQYIASNSRFISHFIF